MVEQGTLNPKVRGSSPRQSTIRNIQASRRNRLAFSFGMQGGLKSTIITRSAPKISDLFRNLQQKQAPNRVRYGKDGNMDDGAELAARMPRRSFTSHAHAYGIVDKAAESDRPGVSVSDDAFKKAVDDCGDTVLRLAMSRLGNRADAEDVYQTVFLKLFQSPLRFRDGDHLKAWLLRVTMNCCNDIRRSSWHKRRAELDDAAAATLVAPADDDDEDDEELALALSKLTDAQRAAVHLFYFEGYSTDEIAHLTGERPATVRSHLHRARKSLRTELGVRL